MVVTFTGSYHGTFDEVLVRAGRGGKGIPAAPGIMAGVFGDVRVLEYGTPEALEFIRTHADDLAERAADMFGDRGLQPFDLDLDVESIAVGLREDTGGDETALGDQFERARQHAGLGVGLETITDGGITALQGENGGHRTIPWTRDGRTRQRNGLQCKPRC